MEWFTELISNWWGSSIALVIGLYVVSKGADWMVSGSVRTALRMHIPTAVIGATVVAFGTSAPELVTSITAAQKGEPGITYGNVIGSNIFNILLILGLCGTVTPMRPNKSILKWDGPWLIISGAAIFLLSIWGMEPEFHPKGEPKINPETGEQLMKWSLSLVDGIILLVLFAGFLVTCYIRSVRNKEAASEEVLAELERLKTKPVGLDVALIIGGFAALVAGSYSTVEGAVWIAKVGLKIDPYIVGMTIVAAGTSLPELATSLAAARKGEGDIAVPNVTGSNIFNILLILGVCAIVAHSSKTHTVTIEQVEWVYPDLLVMIGATLLLLGYLAIGGTITRVRAVVMLLAFVGYTYYMIEFRRPPAQQTQPAQATEQTQPAPTKQ